MCSLIIWSKWHKDNQISQTRSDGVNVVNITDRYTICEKVDGLHGSITFQLRNWIFIDANNRKLRIWSQIETNHFLFLLFFSSSPYSSVPSYLSSSSFSPSSFQSFHALPISLFHCIGSWNEQESDIKIPSFFKDRTEGYQTLNVHPTCQTPNQIITSIIIMIIQIIIIIKNIKKIWEKGCFSHGSQNFFPPTYMRLENGLNTSNICYKVSWNIWKHKFIILKSKFGSFLDGQKKFRGGVFLTLTQTT